MTDWTPPTEDQPEPQAWAPPAEDQTNTPQYVPSPSEGSSTVPAVKPDQTDTTQRDFFKDTSVGRIFDAMRKGASDGWGEEPLWLSSVAEREEMVKLGLFPELKQGFVNPIKAFNEAVLAPAAAGLDIIFRRAFPSLVGGAANLIGATAQEIAEGKSEPNNNLARNLEEQANIGLLVLGGEGVYTGTRIYEPKVVPKATVTEVPRVEPTLGPVAKTEAPPVNPNVIDFTETPAQVAARAQEQPAPVQPVETPAVVEPAIPPKPIPKTTISSVPTFEQFRQLLPKDKDGSPDIAGVGSTIMNEVAGDKAWRDFTPEEKVAAYNKVSVEPFKPTESQVSIELVAVPKPAKPTPKPKPPVNATTPSEPEGWVTPDNNINSSRINTSQDVHDMIRDVSKDNDGFKDARRGKMTLAQIGEMVDASGLKPEDIVRASNDPTNPLLAENHTAARKTFVQFAEETQKAAEEVINNGDEASQMAWLEKMARLKMTQETVAANTTEAARTTSAQRILVGEGKGAERLNQAYKEAGIVNPVEVKEILDKVEDFTNDAEVVEALKEAGIPEPKAVLEAVRNVEPETELPPEASAIEQNIKTKSDEVEKAADEAEATAKAQAKQAKAQAQASGQPAPAAKPRKPRTPSANQINQALQKKGVNNPANMARAARNMANMPSPAQVARMAANMKKPGIMDWIQEAVINLMLTNPITHFKNAITNSYIAFLGPVETLGAYGINRVKSLFNPHVEPVYAEEAVAQLWGLFQGLPQGLKGAWQAYLTGKPTMGGRKIQGQYHQAIPGVAGHAIRSPGTTLMAADEVFKAMNSQSVLNSEAARLANKAGLQGTAKGNRIAYLLANPTPEMIKKAGEVADYRTLTSKLGKMGTSVEGFLNHHPIVKLIVAPFVRTPVNQVKFGLVERTPLGLVASSKLRQTMMGKYGDRAQEEALSRMALGTGLMAYGIKLISEDRITGGGPDPTKDQKAYDAWVMSGKKPYSIRIGNTWYPMPWAEPVATQLGLVADAHDIITGWNKDKLDEVTEDEMWKNAVSGMLYSFGNNVLDKTWGSGAMKVFDAIQDWQRYGDNFLNGVATQIVPTGLSEYTRETDPYLRDARTVMDAYRSKLPWTSQELPMKYDVFGNPLTRPEHIGPTLLSPVFKSTVNNDPVLKALNEVDVFPSRVSRDIMGVELTPQQYEEYSRDAGKYLYITLQSVVSTPGWEQLSPGIRREFLTKTIQQIREDSSSTFLATHPDLIQQAMHNKLKDLSQ